MTVHSSFKVHRLHATVCVGYSSASLLPWPQVPWAVDACSQIESKVDLIGYADAWTYQPEESDLLSFVEVKYDNTTD